MNLTVPQAPERPGPVILSFLSLATSEASSLHEPQATHSCRVRIYPARTWRNAFQVPPFWCLFCLEEDNHKFPPVTPETVYADTILCFSSLCQDV